MVFPGVLEDTRGRRPVPFRAGGPLLELGVVDVEQRQAFEVSASGVGDGVVGTGHAGDEQVGGG